MTKPPCWPDGQACPNDCAKALLERTVYNRQHLPAPWDGWRMAGRDLVSPDGVRISPQRLRGLAWRQEAEARRDAARAKREQRVGRKLVTVIRMTNDDWHRERFGTVAG